MILWLTAVPPEERRADGILAIRDTLTRLGADDRMSVAREAYRQVMAGKPFMMGHVDIPDVGDVALTSLRAGGCDGAVLPPDVDPEPAAPESPAVEQFVPDYQTAQAALLILMALRGSIGDACALAKLLSNVLEEPHKGFWADVVKTYLDTVPVPSGPLAVILEAPRG